MDYDRPARYDLTDPNEDSCGPTATMESRSNGDYVEFSDYDALLEAYNGLLKTLETIHDLSR